MITILFMRGLVQLAFFQFGVFRTTCARVRPDVNLVNFVSNTSKHQERNHTIAASRSESHEASHHSKHSGSRNNVWTHPLALGVVLGLFLVGPDHLGTLMALSTLTSGFESFKSGFYWGVGHSIGLLLLCPIFLVLEHLTSKAIPRESWEYYGNILIGISMIVVSVYFIYYEHSYLQKLEDGTYVAKLCTCQETSSIPSTQDSRSNDIDVQSTCTPCDPSSTSPIVISKSENRKSDVEKTESHDSASSRGFGINYLFGVFQGLCCPLGATAGSGFVSRVTATSSTPVLLGFMVEFVLASGVGSGAIAFAWGSLTTRGSGTLGRAVYIATCLMLFAFGVAWLVAQGLGVLDQIDFEHKIHKKLAPNAEY